ncbi:hypothetical protein ABIC33_001489 [Variovorax sp. 1140]|uniref:hypothetical protein n=1 Tax=Variovorax atrisoli TaxID=3394203 RepID=UPI003394BE57
MGLAISIGVLVDLLEHDAEGAEWLQEDLAVVNEVLSAAGLPPHAEPRELPPLRSRAAIGSFPYSFIHYLRRAYAYRANSPDWMATPVEDGVDPSEDPAVDDALSDMQSHLICHSDAEGLYVPVDFDEVLYAEPDQKLPGGILGSSYRLLDELVLVAPALGIELADGELSDQEAERIGRLIDADQGLHREYVSWLRLYESARLSIAHKTAIVFN